MTEAERVLMETRKESAILVNRIKQRQTEMNRKIRQILALI